MKAFVFFVLMILSKDSFSSKIMVLMDESQKNHLKAYGIAFWSLQKEVKVDWLLNYHGGSFAFPNIDAIEKECIVRGVSYHVISDEEYHTILADISRNDINQEIVKLEAVPKIAIYSPKTKQPWDDAVTMVLSYAEIPYDVIYDQEILSDKLPKYNWLHLHHEDFTGQYGKFYSAHANSEWYKNEQAEAEMISKEFNFTKVSKMKLAVAKKIENFVIGGGFLFAMCSATDSYDIALAAQNTDICDVPFDYDAVDPDYERKMDFSKGFAFQNYSLITNPMVYEYSNIDRSPVTGPMLDESEDYFLLFDFSAKWDQVPTMLTQNHTRIIKGFLGQTTAFKKNFIKKEVLILGDNKSNEEARYIHGTKGLGMWTFYSGHDPEDYQHFVNDPKTDLNLHPNSPGYRLILNNVLFPAAKKKKQKT